jgi:hypothetical protein
MARSYKYLVRVKISNLPNNMHYEFHIENAAIFNEFDPDALGIREYMESLKEILGKEQIALEYINKSVETERIATLDEKIDYTFAGMRDYVNSCLKHYDENKRLAAENLQIIFKKYGNISKKPYRQALALSYNLLDELRKHDVDIQEIDLIPWMKAHEVALTEFVYLLNKRTDEVARKTKLNVRKTRRQVDVISLQIIERLESMINLHGKEFVAGFVSKYNTHATEYKNKYAQHLGRLQANKNKGKDDNKSTDNDENT